MVTRQTYFIQNSNFIYKNITHLNVILLYIGLTARIG